MHSRGVSEFLSISQEMTYVLLVGVEEAISMVDCKMVHGATIIEL